MSRISPTPDERDAPDFSDSMVLARELITHTDAMNAMAQSVGDAKAVLSFSGDRLKRALALAVHDVVQNNEKISYASAESQARASTTYRDSLSELSQQEQSAERRVAEWTAMQARFEALRSLVSLAKAQAQIL